MKRTLTKLIFLAAFAFCPSLFADSYSWSFTGSCTTSTCGSAVAGNSIVFNAIAVDPSSPNVTVKATAWYLNGGTLQQATLERYSKGLGVCSPAEDCSSSSASHQTDTNEFVLFEFSSPVDPSTVMLKTTSPNGSPRDTDASYWLGGSAGQNMNLTGATVANLISLGFGGQIDDDGNSNRNVTISSPGFVNAILFGARAGNIDDYFEITSMGGATVPEPSSFILLGTIGLAALRLRSKFKKRS